jgi:hypothetical protein
LSPRLNPSTSIGSTPAGANAAQSAMKSLLMLPGQR